MFGMIIEALDQVLITVWAPERCTASTFLASLGLTNGPFFIDRDKLSSPTPADNQAFRSLVLSPGLVAECGFSGGGLWPRHSYRRTAFSTAMGMVHRVLGEFSPIRGDSNDLQ